MVVVIFLGADSSMRDSKGYVFSKDVPGIGAGGLATARKQQLINAVEEKKVHFQPTLMRDKKYEGFSSLQAKGPMVKGKVGEKENKKDKKLDEEFIHNLHQHIYYLEMQLKLL